MVWNHCDFYTQFTQIYRGFWFLFHWRSASLTATSNRCDCDFAIWASKLQEYRSWPDLRNSKDSSISSLLAAALESMLALSLGDALVTACNQPLACLLQFFQGHIDHARCGLSRYPVCARRGLADTYRSPIRKLSTRTIVRLPLPDFSVFFEAMLENYPIHIVFVGVAWNYLPRSTVLVELVFMTVSRFEVFRINWVMFPWQMVCCEGQTWPTFLLPDELFEVSSLVLFTKRGS